MVKAGPVWELQASTHGNSPSQQTSAHQPRAGQPQALVFVALRSLLNVISASFSAAWPSKRCLSWAARYSARSRRTCSACPRLTGLESAPRTATLTVKVTFPGPDEIRVRYEQVGALAPRHSPRKALARCAARGAEHVGTKPGSSLNCKPFLAAPLALVGGFPAASTNARAAGLVLARDRSVMHPGSGTQRLRRS